MKFHVAQIILDPTHHYIHVARIIVIVVLHIVIIIVHDADVICWTWKEER